MIEQTNNTRILLLHPKVREEVKTIVEEAAKRLTGGSTVFITSTLRTFEEQRKLYAQGRTTIYDSKGKKLGIVTNSKPGQSYHNYGLALDFALLREGKVQWDIVKDFDGDGRSDWMEVVEVFKNHGWAWGGDFKSIKDYPHFEKTSFAGKKYHWRDLLSLHDRGKVDEDGYVKI